MKKLKLLKLLLSSPKEVITLGLAALAKKQCEVDYRKKNLGQYGITQLLTVDILDLIPGFSGSIHSFTYLNGVSMPTIILMLKCLAQRVPACSYLELGCFRGECMANVADVSADCTSVTLSRQQMLAKGFNETFIRSDRMFSAGRPNITYYLDDTLTFDFGALHKKFDLVSIDADNTYSSILHDTRTVFGLLKDEQSVVVWHNYATDLENNAIRHDVLAGILDGTPPEYHRHLYHVSNTICAIYIRGDFPAGLLQFPSMPTKTFSMALEAVRLN